MTPRNLQPDRDPRFACKCCGVNYIDPRVESLHHKIEQEVREQIPVTSGYRCEKHNSSKDVGGSATSSPLKGLAWDVECVGSRLRYRIGAAAIKLGINRIGIRKDFIHLDIDRQKALRVTWLY